MPLSRDDAAIAGRVATESFTVVWNWIEIVVYEIGRGVFDCSNKTAFETTAKSWAKFPTLSHANSKAEPTSLCNIL